MEETTSRRLRDGGKVIHPKVCLGTERGRAELGSVDVVDPPEVGDSPRRGIVNVVASLVRIADAALAEPRLHSKRPTREAMEGGFRDHPWKRGGWVRARAREGVAS